MIVHLFDQVCQLITDSLNAVSAMALVHCVSVRVLYLDCRPSDCYGLGTAQGSVFRPDLKGNRALSGTLVGLL